MEVLDVFKIGFGEYDTNVVWLTWCGARGVVDVVWLTWCGSRGVVNMDAGKMQNLAAELEVEMMADMYNR